MYETEQRFHSSIKEIRSFNNKKFHPERTEGRHYDFLNPIDLYIVHDVHTAIQFEVRGRKYEVWLGRWEKGGGWDAVNIKVEPVGRIRFSEPVSLMLQPVPFGSGSGSSRKWQWSA